MQPFIEVPLCLVGIAVVIVGLFYGQTFFIPLAFAAFLFYILRGIARAFYTIFIFFKTLILPQSELTEENYYLNSHEHKMNGRIVNENTPLVGEGDERENDIDESGELTPGCSPWIFTILGALFLVFMLIFIYFNVLNSITQFRDNFATQPYQDRWDEVVNSSKPTLEKLSTFFAIGNSKKNSSSAYANDTTDHILDTAVEELTTKFHHYQGQIASLIYHTVIGLVLFLTFFICLLPYVGQRTHNSLHRLIDRSIQDYIAQKSLLAFMNAATIGLVLYIFEVPLGFTIVCLSFVFQFIPEFGIVMFILILSAVVLLVPETNIPWVKGWRVVSILIPSIINFLSGRLEAKFCTDTLYALVVVISFVFWGKLWGPLGMLLAIPITQVIKIVLEHIDHPYTKFVAKILGPIEIDQGEKEKIHV